MREDTRIYKYVKKILEFRLWIPERPTNLQISYESTDKKNVNFRISLHTLRSA